MRRVLVLASILLILALLVACAPREAPAPAAAPAQAPAVAEKTKAPVASRAAWEDAWEQVSNGAKKEGRVVVYSTAGAEVRTAVIKAFKEKYGLDAEFIQGKGADVAEKLIFERRAGLYTADVYIGGTTTQITQLKPAGVLDPLEAALILPEVTDPKVWWGGNLLWVDPARLSLAFNAYPLPAYAINTETVKADELKAYKDLLNPKWKGKISLNDPTVAGISEKGMAFVVQVMGQGYIRELAKQEPVIIRDQRLQVEWLARNKYPIALFCKSDPIAEFRRAGSPIKELLPQEGQALTSGSGNVSLTNRAAHPNAARVFINWLLSKEGQVLFSQASLVQSAREDIPTDYLDPVKLRQPGAKYFWAETEDNLLKLGGEDRKLFKDIFGPLIK